TRSRMALGFRGSPPGIAARGARARGNLWTAGADSGGPRPPRRRHDEPGGSAAPRDGYDWLFRPEGIPARRSRDVAVSPGVGVVAGAGWRKEAGRAIGAVNSPQFRSQWSETHA